MKTHTDYFDAVTRCMMAFQHIEEAMKMVLVRLESLTYFRLKDYTYYDLKPKFNSIQNAAMGRLIDMLKIYTDDVNLVTELQKTKKKRDQVAHQSLLMTVEEMNDKEIIHLKASELEKLNEFANATLMKICERWGDLDKTLNEITAEQCTGANGDSVGAPSP